MYDLRLTVEKDRDTHLDGVGFVAEGENNITRIVVDYPDEFEHWDKRLFFNTEEELSLVDGQGDIHIDNVFSVAYTEPYILPATLVSAKIKSIQFVMYFDGMVNPSAVVDFVPFMDSVAGQEGVPLNYYGVNSVAGRSGRIVLTMDDITDLALTDSMDTTLVGLLKGVGGKLAAATAGVDYEVAGSSQEEMEGHLLAPDPHPQYMTSEEVSDVYATKAAVSGDISGAISSHVELQNPHNQYLMSVPDATSVGKGVVQIGAGLNVEDGVVSTNSVAAGDVGITDVDENFISTEVEGALKELMERVKALEIK